MSKVVMGTPNWIHESTPTPTFLLGLRLRNKYDSNAAEYRFNWLRSNPDYSDRIPMVPIESVPIECL